MCFCFFQQVRRDACFDELEAHYTQLLISSAKNKQTLQKLGKQLKLIKQQRANPARPPPVYHWDKVVNRIAVRNDDIEANALEITVEGIRFSEAHARKVSKRVLYVHLMIELLGDPIHIETRRLKPASNTTWLFGDRHKFPVSRKSSRLQRRLGRRGIAKVEVWKKASLAFQRDKVRPQPE